MKQIYTCVPSISPYMCSSRCFFKIDLPLYSTFFVSVWLDVFWFWHLCVSSCYPSCSTTSISAAEKIVCDHPLPPACWGKIVPSSTKVKRTVFIVQVIDRDSWRRSASDVLNIATSESHDRPPGEGVAYSNAVREWSALRSNLLPGRALSLSLPLVSGGRERQGAAPPLRTRPAGDRYERCDVILTICRPNDVIGTNVLALIVHARGWSCLPGRAGQSSKSLCSAYVYWICVAM